MLSGLAELSLVARCYNVPVIVDSFLCLLHY